MYHALRVRGSDALADPYHDLGCLVRAEARTILAECLLRQRFGGHEILLDELSHEFHLDVANVPAINFAQTGSFDTNDVLVMKRSDCPRLVENTVHSGQIWMQQLQAGWNSGLGIQTFVDGLPNFAEC